MPLFLGCAMSVLLTFSPFLNKVVSCRDSVFVTDRWSHDETVAVCL